MRETMKGAIIEVAGNGIGREVPQVEENLQVDITPPIILLYLIHNYSPLATLLHVKSAVRRRLWMVHLPNQRGKEVVIC